MAAIAPVGQLWQHYSVLPTVSLPEEPMKKKGPRSIPDFSRKQKERPGKVSSDVAAPAARSPKDLAPKPAATSKAGGPRGR